MNRHYKSLAAVFRSFDAKGQMIIIGLILLFVIGALGILFSLNRQILVPVAAQGGNLVEGVVGTPRFINPLLAVSDADRDLTSLVYSGLLRMGTNGQLIPDLAESYKVSEDGLTYTFILRRGLTWQDGKGVTTDDVEFTVQKAQDPRIKSTRRAGWEGVRVEKVTLREIRFHLKQPYATFLDTTTMGILPKHLWKDVAPETFALNELNLSGIGSGPYKIKSVKKDGEGVPLYYDLEPFKDFSLGRPRLDSLVIRFYPGEKDLIGSYKRGEIESLAAITPELAKELAVSGARIETAPLPRVFAVFFNQNEAPIFTNSPVRQALSLAAPRSEIINEVLKGYGEAIDGPLPPGTIGGSPAQNVTNGLAAATEILEKAGWKKNSSGVWEKKDKKSSLKLSFRLATASTPELKSAAEILAKRWRELGAEVTLEVFEVGDLNQNIIRPRKYEALFFGEIVGTNPDPFAFWHSSQRIDPGLNIALYANSATDKLLSDSRTITNDTERGKKLTDFAEEIKKDVPAVFIYAPSFVYVLPNKIQGLTLNGLTTPADRFGNIHQWYTNTEKVWPIFTK